MDALITGGGGFLGSRLAEALLRQGEVWDSRGKVHRLDRLFLSDVAFPEPRRISDARVEHLQGGFASPEILGRVLSRDTAVVFHLAAVVSGGAEEDFELGMKVNLHSSIALLEAMRGFGTCPRLVFASTVAAFGGELPAVIEDGTALTPQTSYGAQKAIVELLLNDYSRRRFVDGRALRLPTIVVRPGKPNKALSSFASSLIREPLEGRNFSCPVGPETSVWVLSPRQVTQSFLRAAQLPAEEWPGYRALALPGLTVTVQEMVEALRVRAGDQVVQRISWEADPLVRKVVSGWPTRFSPKRALAMGFRPDEGLDQIIAAFIEDDLGKND